MSNRLRLETSPYLLQHAENPVDWYPWCAEAFERAKTEDKPVFLSIGYSTCHWCHVMAHESFEDAEIAEILNRDFVSIKVDREERPDIDSIYMAFCQAFTGSGGWPTSIFMTPEQKPFFAGTYFPKTSRGGMIGFKELLGAVSEKWKTERKALLQQADSVTEHLKSSADSGKSGEHKVDLTDTALHIFKNSFDSKNGGFGDAPKFPTPHNLLFLMSCFERRGDNACLEMAEKTLTHMYKGGLFDHIGFGFCRYSTDKHFLVPHFEKMLYDNALLILAYCKAFELTKKKLYLEIAEKTAAYVLREMVSPEGGFYSAQDADSEGSEGKFYLFTPDEISALLGQDEGEKFCRHFDIRVGGNFEKKSIPNLLRGEDVAFSESSREKVYNYRKSRHSLHLDDKILTAWNSLMIAALCVLYRVSGEKKYLGAALRANEFLKKNLCEGNTLFVSFRDGKRGVKGFIDDYAACIFAQLQLYSATLENEYLKDAESLCEYALSALEDRENGGFFLYGGEHEKLLLRPKESYDGAMPSGNSLMAWNLVRLKLLTDDENYESAAERQLKFMESEAKRYPAGHTMFLLALTDESDPPPKIIAVSENDAEKEKLPLSVPLDATVRLQAPSKEYPLKNGRTTYYVCKGHACLPPVNDLTELK